MITRIGILKKADMLTEEQFFDHWEHVHGTLVAKNISTIMKYTQNHIVDSKQRGITYKRTTHEIHGFSQIVFENIKEMEKGFNDEVLKLLDEDEKKFIGEMSLLIVSPKVIIPVNDEKKLIKRMSLLKRKPHLSKEEFNREWLEVHAEHVKTLPGVKGYIQNHIIESIQKQSSVKLADAGIDGIVELWFESLEAIDKAFSSPEGKTCMAHAETFIEEISTFIVSPKKIVDKK